MTNEFEKENSTNQEEEEPSNKETSIEEEATSEIVSDEGEKPSEEETSSEKDKSAEEIKIQRDKLYARLKKEEAKRKKLEELVNKKPVQEKGTEDEWKAKVEFLLENRDISDEEFSHLAAVAMRKSGEITPETLAEAKKSEADYIDYRRKKVADKKKIPASTSGGFATGEKKITPDMKPEEIDAVLKERFEKSQSQKTGV